MLTGALIVRFILTPILRPLLAPFMPSIVRFVMNTILQKKLSTLPLLTSTVVAAVICALIFEAIGTSWKFALCTVVRYTVSTILSYYTPTSVPSLVLKKAPTVASVFPHALKFAVHNATILAINF